MNVQSPLGAMQTYPLREANSKSQVRFGEKSPFDIDLLTPEQQEKNSKENEKIANNSLTETEFMVCNLAGMAGSVAAGFLTGFPLLGILGMFVAPVPVLYGLHLYKKAIGKPSSFMVSFRPSFSKNWQPPEKAKKEEPNDLFLFNKAGIKEGVFKSARLKTGRSGFFPSGNSAPTRL